MSIPFLLLLIIPVVFVWIVLYFSFSRSFLKQDTVDRLLREGEPATAKVLDISQTGTYLNRVPEMRLSLLVERAGVSAYEVEITQFIDLGAMPRKGEMVYVLIDKNAPDNVVLSPEAYDQSTPLVQRSPIVETPQISVADELKLLAPELRKRGRPGVCAVISAAQLDGDQYRIILDVDHIGLPRQRVSIVQRFVGLSPVIGTRTYYIYDPENPEIMALVPAALTTGLMPLPGQNRLDTLVLTPELVSKGAKADGVVLAAETVTLAESSLQVKESSQWSLQLLVTPRDPAIHAYKASLLIALSSAEKTERIAHEGAAVPLRYDPLDLQTVTIDPVAMGYAVNYEAAVKIFMDRLQHH